MITMHISDSRRVLVVPLLAMPESNEDPDMQSGQGPKRHFYRPPPPPPPTGIWMDADIVERLRLSDRQVASIQELDQTFHEDDYRIERTLKELNARLRCEFRTDPVDRERVEALAGRIADLQSERFDLNVRTRIQLNDTLRVAQLRDLHALMHRRP